MTQGATSLEPESWRDRRRSSAACLTVTDLQIAVRGAGGTLLPVVDGVSFELEPDQILGIIGESGSGKTMLCRSLIGTLWRHGDARVTSGSIQFRGKELVGAEEDTWRALRGSAIAYVPQSSLAGLNPVVSVGKQLRSVLVQDRRRRGRATSPSRRPEDLLEMVDIARPEIVVKQRPHELSGGMRQRVMIAAALAGDPALVIADEPTTALDVTVQRRILELLKQLKDRLGLSMIIVSHDLGIIDDVCDMALVLYAGAAMEHAPTARIASNSVHPYTIGLRSAADLEASQPLRAIPGEVPTVGDWPPGCRFSPRCMLSRNLGVQDRCRTGKQPPLRIVGDSLTACLFAEELVHDG